MIEEQRKEVERRLSQLLFGRAKTFPQIYMYNIKAKEGIKSIVPNMFTDNKGFAEKQAREILEKDPTAIQHINDEEKFALESASRMTMNSVQGNYAIIDTSSYILAHSILEGITQDLIETSKIFAPEYWENRVKNKKIEVSRVKEIGIGNAQSELIDKVVEEINWGTMVDRVDVLMSIIQPPRGKVYVTDYEFERDRIVEINKKRNELVHRSQGLKSVENVLQQVDYMNKTSTYLICAILSKYSLKFDIAASIESMTQ